MRWQDIHLGAWLGKQLDVPQGSPWRLWFLRLWLRPATAPKQDVADLLTLVSVGSQRLFHTLRWIWRTLLMPLFLLLIWPVRLIIQGLERVAERIDTRLVAHWADRLLLPMLAIPGLRWLILVVCTIFCVSVVTTPFNWLAQLLFLSLCWSCSLVLRRLPGRYASLALAAISLIAMARYAWWRLTQTVAFDSPVAMVLGVGLLVAEAYTWLVVVLAFIQTAWPLQRPPVALSSDLATWPTVDVFIPTYNEPLSVVRPTTLAAMAMDWPKEKLRIYILDDGRRDEFREFAESMGVGYIIRPDNKHAKAGNLNHALKMTDGELVAIFDCDHMPTRSFLKTSVGWFQRDPQCAMLQTPHHFFSPDPFERNLGTFRRIPNEGELFYGLIQDGNDLWNATFFCGSCAVIRRGPLMQVGGIAVETVTEDAHTALKLHRLGYTTAYINQPLAAGLATESLSAHVGQRIRWARGMAQILRVDSPLLGRGLTLWQRICYLSAMMGFFFGLPKLVFFTAPMVYLFFGIQIIGGDAALLMLYALPYILQSNIANAHIQSEHRHTFWGEVYEAVLVWYVAVPTMVALINPKLGKFNVTAKGGLVENPYFDWSISRPYVVLVLLNIAAFVVGLVRLMWLNPDETVMVLMNLMWTVYTLLVLGAAIGVASESKQVRRTHRVSTRLPAVVYLESGQVLKATCVDFSMTGLGLNVEALPPMQTGEFLQVSLWAGEDEQNFPMRVVSNRGESLALQFDPLSREQEIQLVQCTFARPNAWKDWNQTQARDSALQGFKEVSAIGWQGYQKLWRSLFVDVQKRLRPSSVPSESLRS